MDLHSLGFICFVTFVCGIYWLMPRSFRWLILLASSLLFFFSWRPALPVFLLGSILVTYLAGILLEQKPQYKKVTLILAVSAHLIALFIFKYFHFFSLSFQQLSESAALGWSLPSLKFLLPLGISFYTFQAIGYLIDVFKGKMPAEKHFGYFSLYMIFFAKFLAGPIEPAGRFLQQIRNPNDFNNSRFISGLQLFALGAFKKLVVADNLRLVIDHGMANLSDYKGLSLILLVIFYSWQIYADFSGYTDMARGVARVFGIDLLENFRAPYLATSLRDFWRRWHISLSSWLREYLYFPLGGNRKGEVRTVLNTLIVFLICGLWHGASWGFIIWGLLHGVILSLERGVVLLSKNRLKVPYLIQVLYTNAVVCFTWVFFASPTLKDALYILRNSVTGIKNSIYPEYVWATFSRLFSTNSVEIGIAIFCVFSLLVIDILRTRYSLGQQLQKQPIALRYALYIGLVITVIIFRSLDIKEFVYVQF